jgi:hypothetical protein
MLKKTIFLVMLVSLVSLTTLPSNGYCEDWVYGGSNKYCTLYYNSSSVKIDKQNKIIKVWVKFMYTEKGRILKLEGLNSIEKQIQIDMNHELWLFLLDYKQWKTTVTTITLYSKSGDVLRSGKGEGPTKWQDITPDTLEEAFFNQILKDYKIQR